MRRREKVRYDATRLSGRRSAVSYKEILFAVKGGIDGHS